MKKLMFILVLGMSSLLNARDATSLNALENASKDLDFAARFQQLVHKKHRDPLREIDRAAQSKPQEGPDTKSLAAAKSDVALVAEIVSKAEDAYRQAAAKYFSK